MKRFLKSQSALAIFAVNTQLGKLEQAYVEKQLGCPVKKVHGSYCGIQETSYVVLWGGSEHNDNIHRLCRKHNQQSILIINRPKNGKRTANLFYLATSELTPIGVLKKVTVNQAMLHDGWTKDNGDYYVVE